MHRPFLIQLLIFALAAGLVSSVAAGHSFNRNLRARYTPGRRIGQGLHKEVYEVTNDSSVVLRVLRRNISNDPSSPWYGQGPWQRLWVLTKEYETLATLARRGFPVIEILDTGQIFGRPGDIIEKFSVSSKNRAAAMGISLRTPARGDLIQTRTAINDGIAVPDFQLLIKPNRVVVFDPGARGPLAYEWDNPQRYRTIARQNLAVVRRLLDWQR